MAIIGIDLGTSNSVVSVMEGSEAKVLHNQEGNRTTPSVVAWNEKDEILVGQIAKRQAVTNPQNTIYSAKRFIGSRFKEVLEDTKKMPYECIKKNDNVYFKINDKEVSPQEASSKILQKLKQAAEDYLSAPVRDAVITVPAYFNDAQRQATKDAGKIAGLNVMRIVNEPTAAALAYGLDKNEDETIVVFDFGGGTHDVSVLEVGGGVVQVVSTNGDTHLGGDDIDNCIIDLLVKDFKKNEGINLKDDPMAMQRLKDAAEQAKIELSSAQETQINLPFITADTNGPKHITQSLTRSKFEQMIRSIVDRTMIPVKNALQDANVEINEIDQVILVGGSTRIPLVHKTIEEYFKKEPHKGINPDEVVSIGAAIQGGVLSGDVDDLVLLDVTPLSLGIETMGGITTVMIPRNTTIPTEKKETFSTAADNQASVDVHVLQGERTESRNNRTLGNFRLDGILPAPRGVPKVEVTFSIDANGILAVSAKDIATGKDQHITITSSDGLSDVDIEKLVSEAKVHEEEDKKRKEEIDIKLKLDSMCYTTENMLSEHKDKLTDGETQKLEELIAQAKGELEGCDYDKMSSITTTIEQKVGEISANLYNSATTQEQNNSTTNDDNIIDAEFEETNE
tara:strand:+ start:173 stop:2041 length:1869 start_codon:yes stop_codon:yes gene_type:complete